MSSKRKRGSSQKHPLIDLANSDNGPEMKRIRRSSCASDRVMPDILNASTEFGSPHKFWTSLCEKDEAYVRESTYMKKYKHLKADMRRTLFSWLMDVCEDLTLHRETYHLAIDFFDRLLSKGGIDVLPQTIQLVGTSALFLATKIEEVYPPKLSELVALTDNACTEDEVRRMEEIILSKLEWHCSPLTAIQWLAFYLHLISKQELDPFVHNNPITQTDSSPSTSESFATKAQSTQNSSANNDSQYVSQDPELLQLSTEMNASLDQSFIVSNHSQMRHLGQFSIPKLLRDDFIALTKVIELCIFDMDYLKFTYSQVVAAVVMLFYEPRDQVEAITGFRYNDLTEVLRFVEPVVKVARANVQPGIIIPQFSNVDPCEYHNIQTGYDKNDYDKMLSTIDRLRAERRRRL
ncbi:Cyclin domain containing protein [Aphelenchoides bicaudatus]|nr:Cyclin domain containing protein [Aphelenchoides bicaudatus]